MIDAIHAVRTAPVFIERESEVAVIFIDNPPVNAASRAVRAALLDAIEAVDADPAFSAGVLMGAGGSFIAGSDIKEFDLPLAEPQLPCVIASIEACHKPFVAALNGAALGGGYELALGCDARVATLGTVVGLPETTLGMIPGAGGTQRLPRLVGTACAIDLICTGRRVEATEALRLGMIDAIVSGDLRTEAIAHALSLGGRKNRVIDLSLPENEALNSEEEAAASALKKGWNRPHIAAAIRHVKVAGRVQPDEGLAQERAEFQQLRTAPDARALRYLFFAERNAARGAGLTRAEAVRFDIFGVVGAGTMGAGIALSVLQAGFAVVLVERDAAALERGLGIIRSELSRSVSAGRLRQEQAESLLARLTAGLDISALASCDVIIEAVVEDLDVKRAVFREIDTVARPGAVLASNTSYLDIDALASVTKCPRNVLGLHFFSPAHVMRLLEVVRGSASAPETLTTGLAIARRLGKQPVLAGNRFGFIGNRLYAAYRRECEFMLEEGAFPHEIDAVLEAFGFAMGPFAVADLSGLDIAWNMRRSQAATRDPAARYVTIPDTLCELGRLGRKTGGGYYRYDDGARRGMRDPEVEAIIVAASEKAGRQRRAFTDEEIQHRALIALVNEAALALEDGAAGTLSDIDVVMTNGYGFPRWIGGPVHWAGLQDPLWLASLQDRVLKQAGPGVRRGDLSLLIAETVRKAQA